MYKEAEDAHAKKENPNLHALLEFPKVMYPRDGGKPIVVKSQEEQDLNYKSGYRLNPIPGHVDKGDGIYVPPPKVEAPAAQKGA